MAQTFKIATSSKLDKYFVIGDKAKVSEHLFWQILEGKVKELTSEQPDKYEEVLQRAKEALGKQSLTVLDTWFEIKGKPA